MKGKLLFIILTLFLSIALFGQNQKIDSLKKELKKNKLDKFLDYKNLALEYINSGDIPNAAKYSNITLQYAIDKKNISYIASAKILDSYNYSFKSDFDNAVKTLNEAIKYAEKAKDKKVLAYAHTSLGMIYHQIEKYNLGINELTIAINLYKEINQNGKYDDDLFGCISQRIIFTLN